MQVVLLLEKSENLVFKCFISLLLLANVIFFVGNMILNLFNVWILVVDICLEISFVLGKISSLHHWVFLHHSVLEFLVKAVVDLFETHNMLVVIWNGDTLTDHYKKLSRDKVHSKAVPVDAPSLIVCGWPWPWCCFLLNNLRVDSMFSDIISWASPIVPGGDERRSLSDSNSSSLIRLTK